MRKPSENRSAKKRSELETSVLEVVVACPVDQTNPPDCPLCHLREKKLSDRLKWLWALKDSELEYLLAYHQVCMKTRLDNEPCLAQWGRDAAHTTPAEPSPPPTPSV